MFRQRVPTLEMLYCAVLLYFEQSEKRCSKFKRAYLQKKMKDTLGIRIIKQYTYCIFKWNV